MISDSVSRPRPLPRRRRRRARGAVLVEALIVCLLLALIMAGGLFLHRVYATKIGNMRDARAMTWAAAMRGCQASLDVQSNMQNLFAILVRVANPAAFAPIDPPDYFGLVGHARESSLDVGVRSTRPLGAATVRVRHSMQVACNETIQGERGDLLDVMSYAFQNLLPDLF